MASEQLDKTWNDWMNALSQSYAKTVELVAQQKTAEAAREFKTGVGAMGRKIFSEVASASPKRFEKKMDAEAWAAWARELYKRILKIENSLKKGGVAETEPLLSDLREHFYALHDKTGTRQANDFIYAFHKKAAGEQVEAAELAGLKEGLDKAPPSLKVKAQAPAYAKARAEWAGKVEPILADGKVQPAELPALRKATGQFYKEFGISFE